MDGDSFYMADAMGLDSTRLHYLAVWKAIVSIHRPVRLKIMLTYSLTWQIDRCSPRRMGFKALLNARALLKFSLRLLFEKKSHNGLLLKNSYICTCTVNY